MAARAKGTEASDGPLRNGAGPSNADRLRDTKVWIGDERGTDSPVRGDAGLLRRMHARASLRERQADWFEGMEGAFLRFGGVPAEVLIDNAKALVEHHDSVTREVRFNARLHAFARYWGFTPRACAPYRARTKGRRRARGRLRQERTRSPGAARELGRV